MADHNHITWICLRCDHRQEAVPYEAELIGIAEMFAHLDQAHGLSETELERLARGPEGHVDAVEWYEWDYRLFLDGEPLVRKIIRRERSANDPRRFA